ncbi:MAG: hypothetical protein Q4D31_03515 [Eubacteriales bacterium]|nr:hypothetical protein [Eubacteriales bacterium]
MKRRITAALLAGALCALSAVPAGAADQPPAQTAQADAPSTPPVRTVEQMGMKAVTTAVQQRNPTVLALREQASGIDSTSRLYTQMTGAALMMDGMVAANEALIEQLRAAMAATEDATAQAAYGAQIALLEAQNAGYEQSKQGTTAQLGAAVTQIDDAVYHLRKVADNVAGQVTMGAQSLLIGVQSMDDAGRKLQIQLAGLDRQLAVLRLQHDRGMVSTYQFELVQHQRGALARAIDTLAEQRDDLSSSLALLCGYDADTLVRPTVIAPVSEHDLRAMSYQQDWEQVCKNSFAIWQKRDQLRQAQNAYDREIAGTGAAVQAAKAALAAEQDAVEASFLTLFQTVADCAGTLRAAQTARAQAERDCRTAALQYDRGMIARLAYQQAQDAVEIARLDEAAAQLQLRSAYQRYDWAKQGVITAAS